MSFQAKVPAKPPLTPKSPSGLDTGLSVRLHNASSKARGALCLRATAQLRAAQARQAHKHRGMCIAWKHRGCSVHLQCVFMCEALSLYH